jgi:hypothetical protein
LLSRENPNIGAVCTLHTARVQLKRGRREEARDELKRWDQEYRAVVEHGFVRRLASEVRAKLWTSDGELPLEGLNFEENALRLKKLLVKKVLSTPGLGRPEQAKRLGLANQRQLLRWARDCDLGHMIKAKAKRR